MFAGILAVSITLMLMLTYSLCAINKGSQAEQDAEADEQYRALNGLDK